MVPSLAVGMLQRTRTRRVENCMVGECLLRYELHCAKYADLSKQWSLPVASVFLVGRVNVEDAMESEKTGCMQCAMKE